MLHPVVHAFDVADPPSDPLDGRAWIVGEAPTGDWVGHAGEIAVWTEGGWRFVAPAPGMTAWLSTASLWLWHDGNAWRTEGWPCAGLMVGVQRVVGARGAAIAGPTGGAVADLEARAAIQAMLEALETHGLIAG